MILIMIYDSQGNIKNVMTKTLWEYSEWYRNKVINEEVDRWYDEASNRFVMYMKDGRKYIIEEAK